MSYRYAISSNKLPLIIYSIHLLYLLHNALLCYCLVTNMLCICVHVFMAPRVTDTLRDATRVISNSNS